ncbi:hypothetical protein NMY22_g9695 [Coprinellus aureogranulatus]|nr:hypothetical protein NMY22_g9695 [Coprinellus aureogranulatus]
MAGASDRRTAEVKEVGFGFVSISIVLRPANLAPVGFPRDIHSPNLAAIAEGIDAELSSTFILATSLNLGMAPNLLPQELLDTIVDFVAFDTFESLKTMSLASPRFLGRCRQHLFRKLSVDGRRLHGQERILGIRDTNVSLLHYACHLTIGSVQTSMENESDFSSVFQRLVHLRGLRIAIDGKTDRWFREGLLGHDLIHLSISFNYHLPVEMFYSLPHLRELRLESRACEIQQQPIIDLKLVPWKLKSLLHCPFTMHPPQLLLWTGPQSPVYSNFGSSRSFYPPVEPLQLEHCN